DLAGRGRGHHSVRLPGRLRRVGQLQPLRVAAMADTGSRKLHVRIAAAVLAVIIAAFVVFTYLSYTAAFVPTETVTVTAPRAGLVMERGAKVKYRGIQIGKV